MLIQNKSPPACPTVPIPPSPTITTLNYNHNNNNNNNNRHQSGYTTKRTASNNKSKTMKRDATGLQHNGIVPQQRKMLTSTKGNQKTINGVL